MSSPETSSTLQKTTSLTERPILERLKGWAAYKTGDIMPNDWGDILTKDLKDAVAEIERLEMQKAELLHGSRRLRT